MHVERKGGPRPRDRERTIEAAHAFPRLLQQRLVVKRDDLVGTPARFRPDERNPVALERQDRKRTGREKMLDRPAIMRPLDAEGGNDARLRIGPADRFDARLSAQRRPPSIGRDQKRRLHRPATVQPGRDPGRADGKTLHDVRCLERDAVRGFHARKQRAAQDVVFEHVGGGLPVTERTVKMQKRWPGHRVRRAVGDVDLREGLGVRLNFVPHAQGLEQMHAGGGKCRGAAVIGGGTGDFRRGAIDNGDAQRPAGGSREGQGGGQPDKAPAGDQDVAGFRFRTRFGHGSTRIFLTAGPVIRLMGVALRRNSPK